jgi:hypothetical protein
MRLYNKRANPFGKHKLTFKRLSLILSDAAMCNFVGVMFKYFLKKGYI